MSLPTNFGRRHDIDSLRVIAFGLLIFYHIGMFYVTWGWHVKSLYMSDAAEPLMRMVNPWRLALLFFLSGVAVRYASDKTSVWAFPASRLLRLGIPIVFGMAVIVMPQTYFQLREDGAIDPGILSFWWDYLDHEQRFSVTTPTWNHLWYVVYLLVYILLLTPFLPVLKKLLTRRPAPLSALWDRRWKLFFLIAGPFILIDFILTPRFPTTHALVGDWANHAHRITIFLLGYFAAKDERFWGTVRQGWAVWLTAASSLLIALYFINITWTEEFRATALARIIVDVYPAINVLYAWACILTLLGLAQILVTQASAVVSYLNRAVFCYYILHQTIIVVAGYTLTRHELGAWPEFALILLTTVVGCGVGYELLRRVPYLRIAFGIKGR